MADDNLPKRKNDPQTKKLRKDISEIAKKHTKEDGSPICGDISQRKMLRELNERVRKYEKDRDAAVKKRAETRKRNVAKKQ